MSTDADLDRENVEMVKLNVKVPKPLLDELDDLATELDYPNRSEYVRAVLRDTVEPMFTPEAQERVAEGYADLAAGRTVSHGEVIDRFRRDDAGQREIIEEESASQPDEND